MPPRYEVIGVEGIGEVRPGDDLARLVIEAATRQRTPLATGDVVVLSQKVVSKSEGRLLRLPEVTPSPMATTFAAELGRDPRLIEVILRESRRVVRMDRGVLITETRHGWVCANAGVDQSNVDRDCVALLPEDPDGSARRFREPTQKLTIVGHTNTEAAELGEVVVVALPANGLAATLPHLALACQGKIV